MTMDYLAIGPTPLSGLKARLSGLFLLVLNPLKWYSPWYLHCNSPCCIIFPQDPEPISSQSGWILMILLPSFPWTNHFHILLFFCITVISPRTITWGKSEIESPHVLEKMQNPAASVVRAPSGHLQFCLLLSQAFQLQLLVRFQQLPLQGRDVSVHLPMSAPIRIQLLLSSLR